MALTQYYVDGSVGSDANAGTSEGAGNAWATIQHALDNVTLPAIINVKASATYSLSTALTCSVVSPSFTNPLHVRGYTSTVGDGGQAEIDLTATATQLCTNTNISWRDLEIHNGTGTSPLVNIGTYMGTSNLYIHDHDGPGLQAGQYTSHVGLRLEDLGGASQSFVVTSGTGQKLIGCYLDGVTGTRTPEALFKPSTPFTSLISSILYCEGSTDGVLLSGSSAYGALMHGNTILSSSGSGSGITMTSGNGLISMRWLNNYIEGFSSGAGFEITAADRSLIVMIGNAAYNCNGAEYPTTGHDWWDEYNETLSATGLAKSGSANYSNRFTYFAPADQNNMIAGGWPEAPAP